MAAEKTAIRQLEPPLSLRDTVEKSLSAAIISGELAPGSLVSVPTLAGRFGVSATPVREAMLNLEKRGFVEPVKNKGFRVTSVSEADLREIVQVRSWLETAAMQPVSDRLQTEPVDTYRALADGIVRAAENNDFASFLAADIAFHLALLGLTGNRRLVDMVSELRGQTRMVRLASMANTTELKQSADEHHQLLDLLVAGDVAEAEVLMHRHVGHVIEWWSASGQ